MNELEEKEIYMSDQCTIRGVETALMELLHAVQKADINTYMERVSEEVTCFEPETRGHLLRGVGLHKLLVEQAVPVETYHIELIDPVIQVEGDMAFAAYTLHLTEIMDKAETIHSENVTRIFLRDKGAWKMIHFHRS